MAISKRLRFEILRRDGFKCRYCHGAEVLLTVDHVTPISLGGTDHPSNLVACCDDCNTGKASTIARVTPLASQVEEDLDEEDDENRTVFDDFGEEATWPRILRDAGVSREDIEVARTYVGIVKKQLGDTATLVDYLMESVHRRDLFAIESFYAVKLYDRRQAEGAKV